VGASVSAPTQRSGSAPTQRSDSAPTQRSDSAPIPGSGSAPTQQEGNGRIQVAEPAVAEGEAASGPIALAAGPGVASDLIALAAGPVAASDLTVPGPAVGALAAAGAAELAVGRRSRPILVSEAIPASARSTEQGAQTRAPCH